jgi:hypothetical protein
VTSTHHAYEELSKRMLSYLIVVVSPSCAENCKEHRHPLVARQIRECEEFSLSTPSSDLLMNIRLISVSVRETNHLDHIIKSILTSPWMIFLSMFLSVDESSDVVSVSQRGE